MHVCICVLWTLCLCLCRRWVPTAWARRRCWVWPGRWPPSWLTATSEWTAWPPESSRPASARRWGRKHTALSSDPFIYNILLHSASQNSFSHHVFFANSLSYGRMKMSWMSSKGSSALKGAACTQFVSNIQYAQTYDYSISFIFPFRIGEPEEIGGVIAFLCTDEASYITGETITVTGGIGCRLWTSNLPSNVCVPV